MNPNYKEYRFPQIKPLPWEKVFRSRTPKDSIDFVAKLLMYDPAARPKPLEALLDSYFDELRDPNTRSPTGMPLPDLFNFTPEERRVDNSICDRLVPSWYTPPRK
jgi:glycogen synthase kinase 3 beta